ncbi:hemerythrin domain-containing protein [Jatrophihabitans sp. YIM 134969]
MTTTKHQIMFPGQHASPAGPVDLTTMYLFHFAFRRDMAKFAAAGATTPLEDDETWRRLAARWDVFSRQLHHHHEAEDRVLWPWLRGKATLGDVAMLDAMEHEHEAIDPALAAITEAFGRLTQPGSDRADVRAALVVRLAGVRELLDRHLAHEESDAMTLLQRVTTQRDWEVMEKQFSKGSPLSALVEMVPWAVDGVDDLTLGRLLHDAAPPMRVIHRLTRRRFERRERAAFAYA